MATGTTLAAEDSVRLRYEDAERFCRRVRGSAYFAAGRPVAVARAPGRLDVLGGIADYSGGLVLQLPLRAATLVGAQHCDDDLVVAVSDGRRVAVAAAELAAAPLGELADRFSGRDAWGAYVLGPIALLLREGPPAPRGLRLLVSSLVPEGKGVGSSAAVEISTLCATAACLGIDASARRLALLGQRAEQVFAAAPCGPMDQLAVMHGEADCLLPVLCRPAQVLGSLRLPPPLAVWGIDSGLRHAVSGDSYRRVRCAAFMGKALLDADAAYLTELGRDRVAVNALPERLLGIDFLRLRNGIDDPLSTVEPAVAYPVRAATLFPIEEHARASEFVTLVEGPPTPGAVERLGELLYESHAGYSRCGLGVARTDQIVDAVREAGRANGLFGARVSGGGTVVVLGRRDAEPHVRA
ncbi:MAG: galactokinase family protein, partial [Gaiellaceae bacterium]